MNRINDDDDDFLEETSYDDDNNENKIINNYFSSGIELELGDIIQVISPTNLELNENTYFIYYIDEDKLKLINLSNKQLEQLNLNKNTHTFTDESITEIYLLSRSEDQGYARQNGLTTGQWIDIHFGGEVPIIITGIISNVEEDTIEITSFPENNVFYIDFEYKGIPENIPIDQIVKRDEPTGYARLDSPDSLQDKNDIDQGESDENSPSIEYNDQGQIIINISPENSKLEENILDNLHDMYLDANELFANQGDIYQEVEIPENERKYGLQIQLNDMADQLLSDIPNYKRTPLVLATIQKFINRYKELREKFSIFDQNYNVVDKKKYGLFYKPLSDKLLNLSSLTPRSNDFSLKTKLQWIMPIVKQNKKVYFDASDENEKISDFENGDDETGGSDVIPLEFKNELEDLNQRIMNYQEDLNTIPFEPPNEWKDLIIYKQSVLSDIETIVSNYDDLTSHACCSGKKNKNISLVKYATQRYNYNASASWEIAGRSNNTNRVKFIRNETSNEEKISIKSFMVFPRSVIQYSRVHLPKTNILLRANINQHPFYLFRLFNTLRTNQIIEHKINDFEKNRKKGVSQKNNGLTETGSNSTIYSNDKLHILRLDEDFESPINTERELKFYEQFLNSAFPSNETIIQQIGDDVIQYKFSFYDYIKELEPFMMYNDNIFYKIYNQISYRIKKEMVEYKKTFSQKSKEYILWNNAKFNIEENKGLESHINELLKENDAIYDYYKKYVDFQEEKVYIPTSSEVLSKMMSCDQIILYNKLLSMLLISLMTPDRIIDIFTLPKIEDMSKDDKINTRDCIRRFLTKMYHSIEEMQKDNNTEDVFYDEEYDDSPYSIMDKYKNERKKMLPEAFVEFLKENLLEKHDCPPGQVNEMIETLMNKKKRVRPGEYAVLKLVPSLKRGIEFEKLSKGEKEQIENEKKLKTKIHYYRRVNTHWVKDNDIDENAFLDTNAFFCNIAKSCHKNQTVNTCDSTKTTKNLITLKENRELNETLKKNAEETLSLSIEEIRTNLENQIEYYYKVQRRNKILRNSYIYYQNNLTYEIGKYANTDEILSSPYSSLFNQIRSQDNFPKKQHDLVRFYSTYCREPLPEEDQHWLYCIDTNIKLFPRSLFILASEFVSGGDYLTKLNEVCRIYGKMSDDGDAVVDKYSGYELRKIDFVGENFLFQEDQEDLFKDLGEMVSELLADNKPITKKQKMAKIYEDQTTQHIYNVMASLCYNMNIDDDVLHELIMRLSCELIKTTVMSEKKYNDRLMKDEKKATKKPLPNYEMYKNQTMITLVSSILLVAVQTVVPGIQVRKTFPNCVKSFEGYPLLAGEEDIRGIKYIACVIGKTKSSIIPWNSVEKVSVSSMEKGILNMLKSQVLLNDEVQVLYKKRREAPPELFLSEENIPKEHSIQKWTEFLPPLMKLNISSNLNGLSKDFHEETIHLMRNGEHEQHLHIQNYHVKNRLNTFAIVELINEKVKTKEILLRTMSKIPFLENGCCSENTGNNNNIHPLSYFINEDEHIKLLLLRSMKNINILHGIEKVSKPLLFYNNENNKWKCPDIPNEYIANDVYMAFIHFCNLDNDRPIPPELRTVIQEKPPGYNASWSLEEKIDYLKRHGRHFGLNELHQMMKIIREKNHLTKNETIIHPANVMFKDLLEYLENTRSPVLVEPLCRFLTNALDKNDEDGLRNLRNYLIRSKTQYYNGIIDFLKKYGKTVSQSELNQFENFILNITEWKSFENTPHGLNPDGRSKENEKKTTIINFIKNSIYSMTQDYPNIILNNSNLSSVPTHKWGLSIKHISNIKKIISNEKDELNKFKNKPVLRLFLENIEEWSIDVKNFIKLIPLENGEPFDEETIYLLFSNLWYSVLYQFIQSANDRDLIDIDDQYNKNTRRERKREMEEQTQLISINLIRTSGDFPNMGRSQLNEDIEEEQADIDIMEMMSGKMMDLKETVCSLLTTFLRLGQQNKKIIDKKYEEFSKLVGITKLQEKKAITDFFKKMEDDERKVEYMLKQKKMGRWNLGTQRGIFEYDKTQYDLEENANMARLYNEINGEQSNENNGFDMNPAVPSVIPVYQDMDVDQYERSQIQDPDEGYTDMNELNEEYYDNMGGDEEPDYSMG